MEYWISEETGELHVQHGWEWGNDITYTSPEAEWGTYCPLTGQEHLKRGYRKVSRDEAESLTGLELEDEDSII